MAYCDILWQFVARVLQHQWDRCPAPSRCFAPTFSVYPRKRCRTPSEEVSRGCSWCYTYWLLLCHFKGDRNVQRNVIFNLPSLKLLAWTRFNLPLKSTWTRLELDMHTAIITAPIICLESIDKNEPPRQSKRKRELTNARKGYERLTERIWKMKESTLLFQILSDSFRFFQILSDSFRFFQILSDSFRFFQILSDSFRFFQILSDSFRFFQILSDSFRFFQILSDSFRFFQVLSDSFRFFQVLSGSFRFFQVLSGSFRFFQVLSDSFRCIQYDQYAGWVDWVDWGVVGTAELYLCSSLWILPSARFATPRIHSQPRCKAMKIID